jgi:CrcB protein
MMKTALAIFLGGGAGSLLRYAISRTVIAFGPAGAFPWATWITNLLATGLLAWLVWRVGVGQPGRELWHALLVVGFCGGFSTMSTFSMENHLLLRDGHVGLAVLNIVTTVAGGILIFLSFARNACAP